MTLVSTPRFSGNVVVFQPRPGLGDLIWHLPIIRAIAGATTTGRVTLLTKPSTQADTLLHNDPAIDRIVWFDRNPRRPDRKTPGRHDGPLGYARLIATLRDCHATTGVLLHHAPPLAAAMRLANIKHRYAYGFSRAQRLCLNAGPVLPEPPPFTEAFDQATAFANALGFPNLPEPAITIDPAARTRILARLGPLPKPWIAIGIGCNGTERQWGVANFAALASALLNRSPGTILLLAGAHEQAMAHQIAAETTNPARTHIIAGHPLPEIAALLSIADTFIGNDSGLLNLRAATSQPAHALFGASGPLHHTTLIHPIIPPEGPRSGMANITVASVLDALAH